jgi:glycosyltransferase involved in cell wall biosynthesis
MKKVLIIGPMPPPTGGMETVMEQMKSLKISGYNLSFFNTNKSKLIKSFLFFNTLNFIFRCIRLYSILLKNKYEIIHIHTASRKSFWQNAIFLKISKLFNNNTILHIHGAEFKKFYKESKRKNYITNILNKTDSLIVLSDNWRKYYSTICANKNIYVVNNSIENIDFKKYKRIYPKDDFVVLFLSSICKRKGAYDLLKAIKSITDSTIKFVFVGPYEDRQKFFNDVKILGIAEKCEFKGEVIGNERFKYFASADMLVLPSYAEGLPVTILEAMSFGLPIVSTKVGAIPEVVKEDNGVLIQPGKINDLKKAILYIKKNNKEIKYYKNNIQKINQKYVLKNFKKRISEIYDKNKK